MELCSSVHGGAVADVAARLKKDIESNNLGFKARLQPLKKLAEKYDVSYLVVQKAVKLLCDEGILLSRRGSGIFVNTNSMQAPTAAEKRVFSVTFCGTERYVLTSPVYSRMIYGIEQEAARRGDEIIVSFLRDAESFRKTEALEKSQGFLLVGSTDGLEPLFRDKAVVCVMGADKKWGDHVTYGNLEVGVMAADELIARGHRHVVSINVHAVHGEERCRAFCEHARSFGVNVTSINDPEALIKSSFEEHIEYESLKGWVDRILAMDPRPTAAFVVDVVTNPFCNLLAERGVKLGEELEVITGQYGPSSNGLPYRPLSVEMHPEEVGMLAVRQLRWRMVNPDARRMVIKIEPELGSGQ